MKIAIGIATCGRPEILLGVLDDLQRQTVTPSQIIVSYVQPDDIGAGKQAFPGIQFIQSEKGSCKQRNTIIDAASTCEGLLFIDDDFYLDARYLESIQTVFSSNPLVVGATGNLLADGINSVGLQATKAKDLLACLPKKDRVQKILPVFNTYGCNMCFRMETIIRHHIRFDERLPLYGWFEDVDFSRQLAAYGKIVMVSNAYGVHLGAKTGRTSGLKLGYSQVANPIYLARKGTLNWFDAFHRVATRVLKNSLRSAMPEPYVDRRGRLRGNARALRDLSQGLLDPGRILEL